MKATAQAPSVSSKSISGSAAGTAVPAVPASPQFGTGMPLGTAQALMGLAAFTRTQKLR